MMALVQTEVTRLAALALLPIGGAKGITSIPLLGPLIGFFEAGEEFGH